MTVAAVNSADHPIRAGLLLEWLDRDDSVAGSARRDWTVPPGPTSIEVPLRITQSSIWMRLRYTLAPDRGDARRAAPAGGIVALSQIAEHVFELKTSYVGVPQRGRPITIYAEAVHPVTRIPLPRVEWAAKLSIDNRDLAPIRTSRHDEGLVEFTFDVPAAPKDGSEEDAKVEISARRGDFTQMVSSSVQVLDRLSGRFQSDKPIYQPGQAMHLRAVILDAQGRAAPGAKVTLRVEDQDNERVHTAQLVSSRFGVVQNDWLIPATAGLGTYKIALEAEGQDDYQIANHVVRVSRYELPTFHVIAKPDRSAYLPNQETRVAITATYLFGKPVPKGKVRVIRKIETQWGRPQARKPELRDNTAVEGEADENGTFVAQLDLKGDQEDLRQTKTQRFQDVHFAAYYTDPGSGRTEQRRFDVRITREPIHIYVIRAGSGGSLPWPVYVSTSYADGKPASAAVDVVIHGRTTSLRTNRYGIGKAFLMSKEEDEGAELRATDSAGLTGTSQERYWPVVSGRLRLETGRTLYHAGESIVVHITSAPDAAADQLVMVYAMAGDREVASRMAHVANHQGAVTFPYQAEFRRTVVFAAWSGAEPGGDFDDKISGSKAVIFPDGSDLSVSATASRTSYKPGETAWLRMKVNSPDGKPVQAALGLAIVDQAVLERARTDSEFGRRPWFACAFCADEGETEIGGVRLNDLYALKPAAVITPELDLVAEALVAGSSGSLWSESSEDSEEAASKFKNIAAQMRRLGSLLDQHYATSFEYPQDISTLTRILGRQWFELQDPWGKPYTAKFGVEGENNVITLLSSGPDKQPGTADDFVARTFRRSYFTPVRQLIEQILKKQVDYPATATEFGNLLRENGLLLDALRDPWGTPYRARVSTLGAGRYIEISSAGPDRKFDTRDDFSVDAFSGSYFQRQAAEIAKAVFGAIQPPRNAEEFGRLLKGTGLEVSRYRDAWNRPYRLMAEISSRYGDKIDSKTVRVFGDPARLRTDTIPVTRKFITFSLRSAGPDGIENTYDDFDVVRFPVLLAEEPAAGVETRAPAAATLKGAGTIWGIVKDASGAVIPNVPVALTDGTPVSYESATDQAGVFQFGQVPAGVYSLHASSPGFMPYEISNVPVTAGKTTGIDIELQVGALTQVVMIEASAASLQLSTADRYHSGPVATPRVRDYFPETLVWMPEIVTDAGGTARTGFALADSVTTWKVAVAASTLDGRVAEAESDLRTFQPFFLDFNPPPVLTEGDQVEVPVTIRNYQDRDQKVDIGIQPNDWSTLQGSPAREVRLSANSSANVTYAMQAKSAKENAVQRITANAGRLRDAIERSSRVHPDGQEVAQNFGDLVIGRATFGVTIPPSAIRGATQGELRLYPNIASLLLESASALLISPHGCVEQTISAGYANLVAWRFGHATGIVNPRIEKVALGNVRLAIDGLAGFRSSDGGMRYWATGDPDAAVTAYALSFLIEASAAVPAREQDLISLVRWLEKHQAADGRWLPRNINSEPAGRQAVLLTSLVARSLAGAQKAGIQVQARVLAGAYHHIAQFTDRTEEPYMLAQFILATLDSGDEALLGDAIARLTALGREERGGLYWDLRTNSPFYGWGTAGRYETTGLVISALSAWRVRHPQATELDPAIRRGSVFLLRGRDSSGGWYSTQSTVRAMRAISDASAALGSLGGHAGKIEVRVNGRAAKVVAIPSDANATEPILVDMSAFLSAGDNQIDVVPSAGTQGALVRFWSKHWLPWAQTQARSSPELRLAVQFDRMKARAGEPVRCSVKAERVGFRGYGMMLAEIGLPPGAEVDRATLEALLEDGSSGVDRYDVLPDRVILYLWPKAGGASFDFYVSARMPMTAKSATSVLYDYYNPEALMEVVPVQWVVNGPARY